MESAGEHYLILYMLALYTVSAILALLLPSRRPAANIIPQLISAMAALFGIAASISHIMYGPGTIRIFSLTTAIPYITIEAGIDKLSSFFILSLSVLTLSVSVYSLGYTSHYYGKRNVGLFNCLYNLFILSMVFVFMAC